MSLPSGRVIKWVISGAVSSSDVWNIGLWTRDPVSTALSQAALDALTLGCLNSFKSKFWSAASSPWAAQCATATNVSDCKAFEYQDGALVLESQATQTAVAGSAAGQSPAYCAAVFTLGTAGFGRRARGRLYVPHTGGVYNSGTLSLPVVQQHCDNLAAWISDALAGGGSWGTSDVVNPAVISRVGSGQGLPITQVSVNQKPDTMRSRVSDEPAGVKFLHTVP